jgi:hypothetical protein
MFGDVYQLPPVVEENLAPYFEAVHNGHFFFNAHVWRNAEFKVYELTQVFRQKDPIFKDILNAVRDGTVTEAQIEQLNARHGIPVPLESGTVTLAPTNALVTEINQRKLDLLEGEARQYTATITGKMGKSTFPTEEVLQLKKGAQIVMLKNDSDKRWVNGTVGKIDGLFDDHIDVSINGVVYTLERESWEEVAYTYDIETQKVELEVKSSFTQYPIRLAWALTIHKSQGQTYQSVELDLTTAAFAAGQMYVALSRCTCMEGLYLKMPVKQKDVIVDAKVSAFMARRETIKAEVVEEEQVVIEQEESEIVAISEVLEVEQTRELVTVPEIHHDEIATIASVQFHHDEKDLPVLFASSLAMDTTHNEIHHDEIEDIIIDASRVEDILVEGRVSRIAAIEVLCPACNAPCVDPATKSAMITYELVGHSVVCSNCEKKCIVPLNAFSMQDTVIAREQPKGVTNAKREKKGRTKKEKKSNRGRKAKDGVVREPCQLSLSVRTINALNAMGVNKSALYEDLLEQYGPFLEALAMVDTEEDPELDHDEIDDEMEE